MSYEEKDPDAETMAQLAKLAARVDPVPDSVTTAAKGSFAWASAERDLAELVYDSAMEAGAAVGVRGDGSRHCTFEGSRVTVELEVGNGRLLGQVVPPRAIEIEICRPDQVFAIESDALGRFSVDPVSPGPLSLRCRVGDGTPGVPTATEWVSI